MADAAVVASQSLVTFETADGLRLNGILALPTAGEPVAMLVHVHGKCGNFYENAFVRVMAATLPQRGVGLLSFNSRGHACIAEAYRSGQLEYVGGARERFEESLLDVGAAVQYARARAERVVLQGHSYGCDKVLWYALHRDSVEEFVALSPADSYALQTELIAPETLEGQSERLRALIDREGDHLVAAREYGVRGEYDVPIFASALIATLEGQGLKMFRFDAPWTHRAVGARAFAYVGGADRLQTVDIRRAERGLRERFAGLVLHYEPNGDHQFHGHEETVVDALARWINHGSQDRRH